MYQYLRGQPIVQNDPLGTDPDSTRGKDYVKVSIGRVDIYWNTDTQKWQKGDCLSKSQWAVEPNDPCWDAAKVKCCRKYKTMAATLLDWDTANVITFYFECKGDCEAPYVQSSVRNMNGHLNILVSKPPSGQSSGMFE